MLTVPEFAKRKKQKEKITMITCYDASFARILSESPIEVLLIGDSSSMVMQGEDSTIQASPESMVFFTKSVANGTKGRKFLVSDMPFLSTRKGLRFAVDCAETLLKAGAHAVKIEGILGNEKLVSHLVESGIPVMGHLGLTPQFVNAFGGMKVQARSPEDQERLQAQARQFQDYGAFAVVLECIPSAIASKITNDLSIPTIGIGAGSGVDGQVLVLQDMLGFNPEFKPKFLRTYLDGKSLFIDAFHSFHEEVKSAHFPNEQESYL
ncbi:MAG: 3-methyl-2-oxobutanoate hydroxymethyltransferase [Bdellovibrionales bacterium]|nr:3-methyl-2-oxobutanoate hydroxymethyltransferase [Bdellovibrionales bacterium]